MSIKLKCPKCGESYKVADDRAGQSFRCRQCQGPVKVPVDMFVAGGIAAGLDARLM